jgi:hypothetical protein
MKVGDMASGELMMLLALIASLFFYGLSQSRIQLAFFLIAIWVSLLLMSRLYPWMIQNNALSFVEAGKREVIGGAGFLLFAFLLHIFFRRTFGGGHAETAVWWRVLTVAVLEAGLISASLFALFDFSSFIALSPIAYTLIASSHAFIVWLLLPFFGILLLAKRRKSD